MASVARRHHTIPRFYLDGFAKDGRIGVVRLPGSPRFAQSTAKASTRTDFYSIPDHTESPDVFEKALSQVEGNTAGVLKEITSGDGDWPLDPLSRGTLAAFVAIQFLRGPDQRRAMEQLMALTTQLEVGIGGRDSVASWAEQTTGVAPTPEQAAKIWRDVTQPGGPPVELSAYGHIEQILEALPQILPYVICRPWALIRFNRKTLLTCDTPVAMLPEVGASPHIGVGLGTAWMITFPLSRNIGLALRNIDTTKDRDQVAAGVFDTQPAPSGTWSGLFNAATIRNTREWLFHHPDDDKLIPKDLPPPLATEINAKLPRFKWQSSE